MNVKFPIFSLSSNYEYSSGLGSTQKPIHVLSCDKPFINKLEGMNQCCRVMQR